MLLLLTALTANPAHAGADVGGYFRVMTRPDLQGGGGRLGYWNLYGRLLNEGPWAALDLRVPVLERTPGAATPWTSVHARVEGGSIGNADSGNGNLANLRLSQVYVRAGNVLLEDVTWQIGTLEYYFGDLGLYDMRPAQIFFETVGVSGRYEGDRLELLLGVGDSGYFVHGSNYNTIFTPGGTARLRVVDGPKASVEVGVGGQLFYEPAVIGNRFAPHVTPEIDYADFLRGEVVQSFLEANPGQEINFPDPEPTSAVSGKVVGYLGFGGFGPLRWNNLFASYTKVHPEKFVTENYQGEDWTLYITELTDERYQLTVGDEMQLGLIPGRLDAVIAGLYAANTDLDNDIAPSDHDMTMYSTVLRLQTYVTPTVHWLLEGSAAQEISRNGNRYREHYDSIFTNTAGASDPDGFEYGDSDTRTTFQGKTGVVLNPLGPGVYTRPSLRLLYGVQYSSQNNAYGNSFVEDLDQYNDFGNIESHVHHVLAAETEVWF